MAPVYDPSSRRRRFEGAGGQGHLVRSLVGNAEDFVGVMCEDGEDCGNLVRVGVGGLNEVIGAHESVIGDVDGCD